MFAIIPAAVHTDIIAVYMIMMHLGVFFVYLLFGWHAYNVDLLSYEGTANYLLL
jgi:hypothetical protein